jgi:hypothetical protein
MKHIQTERIEAIPHSADRRKAESQCANRASLRPKFVEDCGKEWDKEWALEECPVLKLIIAISWFTSVLGDRYRAINQYLGDKIGTRSRKLEKHRAGQS